jgi:molecular chaperone GrpE
VTDEPRKEPQVRVVDRRWWAREHTSDEPDQTPLRKPTYVEDLERQLADLTTRMQELGSERRRSQEEFEQARIRIRRDVGREVERGKRVILADLLEVLDNLDRAIAAAREGVQRDATDAIGGLLRGIDLVRDQFRAKLAGFGVVRLDVIGSRFDAARHEAVSTTSVDDPSQDETVVAVVKEGYAIGDEILRPASVVVGKCQTTSSNAG